MIAMISSTKGPSLAMAAVSGMLIHLTWDGPVMIEVDWSNARIFESCALKCVIWVMMSNLYFNDHFLCPGWQTMPVFVFNVIYKLLRTSWTGIFLFNIMLTEDDIDTFTSITHHYSNAITQFITQFITQMPLLKSLLIITQMPFSLLTITPSPPLLRGHFQVDDDGKHITIRTNCTICTTWTKVKTRLYNLISWSNFTLNIWSKV